MSLACELNTYIPKIQDMHHMRASLRNSQHNSNQPKSSPFCLHTVFLYHHILRVLYPKACWETNVCDLSDTPETPCILPASQFSTVLILGYKS